MSIPIFEKIEKIRTAEILTQSEFAEKIGISVNTLIGMKSRGSSPRADVIEAVASCYPQYAFWLITDKTDPPRHIAPNQELGDTVLFDVIESIDQDNLIGGESFVDKGKMDSVIFLVEDTKKNRSMNIFIDIWIDELKNTVHKRYFAPPVISIEPRFDLWVNNSPEYARDFRRWCDVCGIKKFRLIFVKEGTIFEIHKNKIITKNQILSEVEDAESAKKIMENFNMWKDGGI